MHCTWDPLKDAENIQERGIPLSTAARVFEGAVLAVRDRRADYGDERWYGLGRVDGRLLALAWTVRGGTCCIISARIANDEEERRYAEREESSG
jgi:uncharacterized DUF497 family protein